MITTTEKLRQLCIDNKWFTCGTNGQYEKLFYANKNGCPVEEIATIIWLCSDDDCCRMEVLDILQDAHKVFLETHKNFTVYMSAGRVQHVFKDGLTYDEAQWVIETNRGVYVDGNGFAWDLWIDDGGCEL